MRHSSKQSRWGHDMLLLAAFAAAMGLVLTSTSSRADPIASVPRHQSCDIQSAPVPPVQGALRSEWPALFRASQ